MGEHASDYQRVSIVSYVQEFPANKFAENSCTTSLLEDKRWDWFMLEVEYDGKGKESWGDVMVETHVDCQLHDTWHQK